MTAKQQECHSTVSFCNRQIGKNDFVYQGSFISGGYQAIYHLIRAICTVYPLQKNNL